MIASLRTSLALSLPLVPQVVVTAVMAWSGDHLGAIPGLLPFCWIGVGALWWFGAVEFVERAHKRARGVDPSPALSQESTSH